MANEYGELEQLVNDVTSLDTARMTLRWALERLNSIEKEKADLKRNLTLAEETAKKLQLKDASLADAFAARSKTLEEKEDFYTKLEATMSLLGEGKLDIQQLLKKEAKLESLRKSLEAEYEDKFAELDRSQRSIIERWNGRLLEVESQYAGRLAEAQKKYDSLRAELEGEYQGRLTSLQASFKGKEKELLERIALLEGNVHDSEARVERRRAELEAEYQAKRRETEENYRRLRAMLESGQEEKLRAMDSDHQQQVRQLEASWQAERGRLLEEQRVREEQFLAAQERIKQIENDLAVQQERHHSELLKLISEKEAAFRGQLEALERERAAQERGVRELTAMLEKRAAGWEAEKASMRVDFDARLAAMDAALKSREAELEKTYAARREEAAAAVAGVRAELEAEFENLLAAERRAAQAERERAAAQLAAFEEERRLNIEKINALSEEMRVSLARFEREKAEAAGAARQEADARLVAERGNWDAERGRLEKSLDGVSAQFRESQLEIVSLNSALRKAAEEGAAREAEVTAEINRIRTDFDKELAARVKEAVLAQTAALVEAIEALKGEKAALESAVAARDAEINALKDEAIRYRRDLETKLIDSYAKDESARRAELEQAYVARAEALEQDFLGRRAAMEKEFSVKAEQMAEETKALRQAMEAMGAEAAEANNRAAELSERLLAAGKAHQAEKLEMQKAYARELDQSVEGAVKAVAESLEAKLVQTRGELDAANSKVSELSERLLAAEKKFHDERLEMQKMHVKDVDQSVESAVGAAVELLEERLAHTHEELVKTQKKAIEELRLLEEGFAAERARMLEDMDRRDRYIESADSKIQDLEREMMKFRQESTSELMRNVAEQDRRFREAAAEEKARNEGRIRQLEELLSAKEQLLADSDKFCRQKQLELDRVHAELNERLNKSNEDLFAQKQALTEKERELNEFRLKLEKDYSIRSTELEQMKAELSRAIMEYKGRK